MTRPNLNLVRAAESEALRIWPEGVHNQLGRWDEYEKSHDVSVGGNPATGEVVIRFMQGHGSEAIFHTLRTTGIVSHEMIRPDQAGG